MLNIDLEKVGAAVMEEGARILSFVSVKHVLGEMAESVGGVVGKLISIQ